MERNSIIVFIVSIKALSPMSRNANNPVTLWPSEKVGRGAFTLVELMAVIAVIAVMMAAITPAFTGIKGAGDVTRVAYDVAGTLDQARAYAMANNTYVFVGFAERNALDTATAGVGQILMVAMGSLDGTRSFGTSNSNLVAISKLRRIDSMHLEDSVPNSGGMSRPDVDNAYRIASEAFASPNSFAAAGFQFTKIIQFDPRGSASTPSSPLAIPQWMEIGLIAARGNTVSVNKNCAALVLDGVTGSARIYRP